MSNGLKDPKFKVSKRCLLRYKAPATGAGANRGCVYCCVCLRTEFFVLIRLRKNRSVCRNPWSRYGPYQCPVSMLLAVLFTFTTPQKHLPSLTVPIINSHKNRKFSRLCKWVGLHYIGFANCKAKWRGLIVDFIPKFFFIFPQLRNLG